ncbi:hypothetical protein CTAYLR_008314 [Chrysophaeum taylorii]|uniref:RRM domain-containing protein n=1 Tax=Chrysophaeum taylorii TaxID=2483200 RepID=A0AAD7U9V6_9STRA|nr:hypothetical protein CTAYLR_008314 [Chrysophaeum taylorii]
MDQPLTQIATKTIHVGNLSPSVSVDVLRQIFGCIGQIVDVRVAADGRYGFVDFAESEAATASLAMNGTEVCGQALRVQRATQPRLYSNQANPPPAPMLAQLQPVPEFSAIAGVTSAAALEALQKQARKLEQGAAAPVPAGIENMPNFAFMNPAQQRAALEARHREMLAKSDNVSGWGVAKRHDSDTSSSEDSSDRDRRRRRRRRRDYDRRRHRDDDDDDDRRRRYDDSPPRRRRYDDDDDHRSHKQKRRDDED